MKCAAQYNRDKRIKQESTKQTVKFMLLAFGIYLGDKRGWQPDSIYRAIKWINKFGEMLVEDLTTYKEAEEAFEEDYGIHIDENGVSWIRK